MIEDTELLRRYVDDGSETAFAELVQRHLGLVYAAALRQLGGATHRAEEATQGVFIALARKARTLTGRRELGGWLYTSTHYACAKIKRTEQRRQSREQEAFLMNETSLDNGSHPDWEHLRPVLDEVLLELKAADREAILLRFFHGRRLAEVGATFSVSEDAARMRIERALDRLREALGRRGVTSTSAALGLLLANQPAVAIPAALGATVTGAALAAGSGATLGGAALLLSMMNAKSMTTLAAAGAMLALGLATYTVQSTRRAAAEERIVLTRERDALRDEVSALRQREAELVAKRTAELAQPFRSSATQGTTASPTGTVTGGPQITFTAGPGPSADERRANQRRNIDLAYAALYRRAGWTAAQQETFRAIMADRETKRSELFRLAVREAQARNPSIDRAERYEIMQAVYDQSRGEALAEVRRAMGDVAADGLAAYQEELPARGISNQLASILFNRQMPITVEQVDRLTPVLARHAIGPLGSVEIEALNADAAVAQVVAEGILNSDQLAELRIVVANAQALEKAQREANTVSTDKLRAALKVVEEQEHPR